jgi:hypothetical protein
MYVNSSCTGLFLDKINNLYCSSANEHRVFKAELKMNMTKPITVAGNGCPGPVSNVIVLTISYLIHRGVPKWQKLEGGKKIFENFRQFLKFF